MRFRDVRTTIIIDLEGKTLEEVLKQADRSRRKNINKANSYGLLFKEANEKEWLDYHQIYSGVWQEGGVKPEPIQNLKKENYKLFVAKKEDKVLGGGLVEIEENSINFVAFAARIEYQEMRVNDFLYWNSIEWAYNHQKRFVDLGGYQLNPRGHLVGINSFKEKWGGKIVYQEIGGNFLRILGRKVIRKFHFARWIWDRFKGRPISKKDRDIKYKEGNF